MNLSHRSVVDVLRIMAMEPPKHAVTRRPPTPHIGLHVIMRRMSVLWSFQHDADQGVIQLIDVKSMKPSPPGGGSHFTL
jgi:hypothetical protein